MVPKYNLQNKLYPYPRGRGGCWALGRQGRSKLSISALTGSSGGTGKGSVMPPGEGRDQGRLPIGNDI